MPETIGSSTMEKPSCRIPLPVPPNTIKLPGSGVKKRFIGLAGGMQPQGMVEMTDGVGTHLASH
jgi:hypothetical protein